MVPTITLDTLVKKYGSPDYIKLDIEGWEYKALLGLTSKQGVISFEWSEEIFHIAEKCVNHLTNLGYKEFCVSGYFEEGDVFRYLEYNREVISQYYCPKKFFGWDVIQKDLKQMINKERRMNVGMIFVQ
jgi:hypothetical protein